MNTKLESALRLAEQGFRVFPLRPNSKLPAIRDFAHVATTDKTKINSWFEKKDYNIGISTEDLLVVDIDIGHNGIESVKNLQKEGKKLPLTFEQQTATGGFHLIFKAPFQIKNSVSKIGQGIDTRGRGGYIVGSGSTIDGKSYTAKVAPLANAPDWLLESCERDAGELSRAKEIAAEVDPEQAWERGINHLKRLDPVSEGERNAAAYKTANQLKDIGATEADAFALMLEYWKCEPLLEYGELSSAVRSAYTYGKDAQGSKSPEAMFGELDESVTRGGANPILALNAEYAFVKLGGKHSILHETTDADDVFKAEFLDEATFHAMNASRMFVPDAGAPKPLTKLWMQNPGRRTYEGLVFKPEQKVDPRFYNLWRGFNVKEMDPREPVTDAMKRAYDAFTSHIFDNVAHQNKEHYDWVMGWFAHMLQKPYEKPGTALVFRGRKGVGKNAIFEVFQAMFPNHYLVSGDRRYLVSNFNSHLERLLLFVADEAFWSGDKASEGILKSLITDRRLIIERKGKEALNIESNHRIAILGNEAWVVPASHDERRYAIFDMGETRKQDRAFFGGMARDMRLGGTRYLFTRLRQLDFSSSDIGQIPNTGALAKQKLKSMGLVEQWWYGSLCAGIIPHTDPDKWSETLTMPELQQSFKAYANSRGRGSWLDSDEGLLDSLKNLCPSIEVKRKAGLFVVIPPLDTARALWDLHMNVDTPWV